MTTLNGFARLGIADARSVAELRPHLDPAADAPPPAAGSNAVPIAVGGVDRTAAGAPFIPAWKLRAVCAPDAAWMLGLDRADAGPAARLRAILGRAYARANWYAWNLGHQIAAGKRRDALARALGAVLDDLNGPMPDLHALRALEMVGDVAGARELHRRMAGSVEWGKLTGRPEDHARRFFLMRLAEAWAASTGTRPALDREAVGPERRGGHRKRGGQHWQDFAQTAFDLTGLAKAGGLDSLLRSLNAPLDGLAGGRSLHIAEELAERADTARRLVADLARGERPARWGRMTTADFASEGLAIDVDSLELPFHHDPERPPAERSRHGSMSPSGPDDAYADFAPVLDAGWLRALGGLALPDDPT